VAEQGASVGTLGIVKGGMSWAVTRGWMNAKKHRKESENFGTIYCGVLCVSFMLVFPVGLKILENLGWGCNLVKAHTRLYLACALSPVLKRKRHNF
jgi:hypothetical protein